MNQKTIIDFLRTEPVAMIGVSSSGKKYGNHAFKTLTDEGYKIIPVNPKMSIYYSIKCYPNLSAINPAPKSLIISTKPENTLLILDEFKKIGGEQVWFQQGADFGEAVDFCKTNGIKYYQGYCILMVSRSFPHSIHRLILKLVGSFK